MSGVTLVVRPFCIVTAFLLLTPRSASVSSKSRADLGKARSLAGDHASRVDKGDKVDKTKSQKVVAPVAVAVAAAEDAPGLREVRGGQRGAHAEAEAARGAVVRLGAWRAGERVRGGWWGSGWAVVKVGVGVWGVAVGGLGKCEGAGVAMQVTQHSYANPFHADPPPPSTDAAPGAAEESSRRPSLWQPRHPYWRDTLRGLNWDDEPRITPGAMVEVRCGDDPVWQTHAPPSRHHTSRASQLTPSRLMSHVQSA